LTSGGGCGTIPANLKFEELGAIMKKTKKTWKLLPLVRTIGILSAVGIITTAVTFAALQSNGNALTGNTIQTATASLLISTQGTAGSFSASVPGFNFTGLVPGGSPQPVANNYTVYLQNTGTANLKLLLNVPTLPVVTGTVDLSKVMVLLAQPSGIGLPQPVQAIPLSSLIAGTVSVNNANVNMGGTIAYHVQVSMDSDAVTGNGVSISGLDLSFSGTPQ
jgi:hypothetical protein